MSLFVRVEVDKFYAIRQCLLSNNGALLIGRYPVCISSWNVWVRVECRSSHRNCLQL